MLLYESDENVLAAYSHAFKRIFSLADYEADIVTMASGSDTGAAADDALFETVYFDVLISDVSLGDIGNQLGLRFLTMIKSRHPDIFTVAFTGLQINYRSCSNKHRFDLYVDKQRIEVKNYQEFVASQLKQLICVNPFAVIKSSRSEFWPDLSDGEWLDLQRIVRRITYTGPPDGERSSISSVRLRRIEGGFSGASVFSLMARTGSGQACVQAVLKIARVSHANAAASVRREVSNYHRLVRWHLPYHWRPELLGSSSSRRLEALCYAFVSTREAPFETLHKAIREGRIDVVEHAILAIFHPSRRRWYDSRNIRRDEQLMSFYLDHCFGDGGTSEGQLEKFRSTLKEFDISLADRIRVRDLEVLLPSQALFGKPAGTCLSCLIHGDLNTSNVFVSTSNGASDVMLIDFASARRGHVFYDFIVFEANLRLDYREKGKIDLYRRIHQERALNSANASDVPCSNEILLLRQFAFENFRSERRGTYLYGLAAFCFSLMSSENLSDIDHQILAATICAAILDLQQERFWELS